MKARGVHRGHPEKLAFVDDGKFSQIPRFLGTQLKVSAFAVSWNRSQISFIIAFRSMA